MTRIIGGILLTASGAFAAYTLNSNSKKRALTLASFADAFMAMQMSLEFSAPPLKYILKEAAGIRGPCSDFFNSVVQKSFQNGETAFSKIWEACVNESDCVRLLTENERAELYRAGDNLGRYDLQANIDALARAYAHFRDMRAEAEKKYKTGARTNMTLGIAAGAAAALLLL